MSSKTETVDYDSLDNAKKKFMAACQRTLSYAKDFGHVSSNLGNSSNIFSLNLAPYLKINQQELYVSMLPEGLGTADDARPNDLSDAEEIKFWKNIGLKTMSCLTNDAASSGIQTLLLGLYLPSATPETVFTQNFCDGFLAGIDEGCKSVGCVYFCGETPQLKNKIYPNKLDIAGSLFGCMAPGLKPVTGQDLAAGDYIVFVESSGPHENGFTTLRKMSTELKDGYRTKLPSGQEYWQAINQPGILYTELIQTILKSNLNLTNIEPITGHGWQKLMRQPIKLSYQIENILEPTEVFSFIEKEFKIPQKQMLEIFNYGTGLALFSSSLQHAENIITTCTSLGLKSVIAGQVHENKKSEVNIKPYGICLKEEDFSLA